MIHSYKFLSGHKGITNWSTRFKMVFKSYVLNYSGRNLLTGLKRRLGRRTEHLRVIALRVARAVNINSLAGRLPIRS